MGIDGSPSNLRIYMLIHLECLTVQGLVGEIQTTKRTKHRIMKNKPFRTTLSRPLAVAAILAASVSASHAAISLVNTASGNSNIARVNTLSFDAGATTTKLIVSVTGETGGSQSITATYNGTAMTLIPGSRSGRATGHLLHRCSIHRWRCEHRCRCLRDHDC